MANEVSTQVLPMQQLERMAQAIAKSGMFSVKTPEGALTLMLVAQAENIPAAQAMMDYDLIQGKPALKAAAMLARFQRSGGKVQWLRSDADCVSGKFTHPSGGELTVTWDTARVELAGLSGNAMHKKYPIQMKRARCISEACRALAPGSVPLGMYTVDVTPEFQTVNEAVTAVVSGTVLTEEEIKDHLEDISSAEAGEQLRNAFGSAYKHAKESKDLKARDIFQAAYEARKGEQV